MIKLEISQRINSVEHFILNLTFFLEIFKGDKSVTLVGKITVQYMRMSR